ncbi:MAG: hypothetical protein KDD35_06660 [Bdellovibrionales bacterium]|nr:hypothetical protein [Bdellovibrionales bacterium]
MGQLSFEELSLRAGYFVSEGQNSEFNLNESLIGFSWRLDKNIRSFVGLGGLKLINSPLHYSSSSSHEWGLVEAYGEYMTSYGRWRFGLIPLEYAIEGSRRESELEWSRSLLFKRRVVGLRDYGISYSIDYEGFYSRWAFHNGEGDGKNARDSRVWMTSSWGWTNFDKLNFGFSGNTGRTAPIATSVSGDNLAGVDPTQSAKWSMATFYLHYWTTKSWSSLLELTWGGREQDEALVAEGRGKFFSGHFDWAYDWSSQMGILLRGDYFDPNLGVSGDIEREFSLAWSFRSQEGNSRLYLMGTKVLEEGGEKSQINNDLFQIVWHLSSESFSKKAF